MVIIKPRISLEKADVKIIKDDYVIADGTSGAAMGFAEKTPFGRPVFLPIFYIFKVHKNYPLRVLTKGRSFAYIYPAKEHKHCTRMPAEVYKDRMDYDLTAFFLAPYTVELDKESAWKCETIKEGFTYQDGRKQDVTLLSLLETGFSTHSCDSLKVSQVLPTQIVYHLSDWISGNHEIYSHDRTFHQKLEGRISIDESTSIRLAERLTFDLEKRYKSKLFLRS